ncbi:MAG: helix-turn-helix domain protein [Candidatus Magnetoglobus multicellularis str. Araruama]|uniref:Helix-turn-helix domain protein n=1 Tax=Candidatus Magnetoglobus multicellularis str. Araruama TaxID=890399 RepID=A0A1V1NZ70_9BACT|nr:MAG: helix-turn-helix domain protein [Candidatus Magnetoglobus multicellularis str. Araruama]
MKRTRKSVPPYAVVRSLKKLGSDIHSARLRRRIPSELLAERALISRSTLHKIEKGDPGVSMGNYAGVLFGLGMGTPFADIADIVNDPHGRILDEENLPKRIRKKG